jgi:simple sugar transport system ATP-binding protein
MANTSKPVLELKKISKHFTGVAALSGINFNVSPGEVLCLLGDNGAGKSTLIKILSGVHRPTEGEVLVDGKPVKLRSPREAQDLGIATVHQDIGVISLMSVARNFFLGLEPTKGWGPFKRIDHEKARAIVIDQITAMGIRRVRDGNQLVGVMSVERNKLWRLRVPSILVAGF